MANLSSFYPQPVVAGTTAGTYAEGNAPRIIDVTHAQLLSLMGSQSLKRGFHYRITDFVTEYMSNDNEWISPSNTDNVSNNNGTAFTVASIAATPEPLIVYAHSSSKVSREAYSETYPQDIIHYDPEQTYLNGTQTAKGFIVYRKDTFNNIETDYDWRNIRFKRWSLNPNTGTRPIAAFQPSTNYVVGDIVTESNLLYLCVNDHTSASGVSTTNFIPLSNFVVNPILLHELGLFESGSRKTENSATLYGGTNTAFYYATFANNNGELNTTNRFKDISIKSLKPPQQNPNFSSTLPNIVLVLNSSNTNYYRFFEIKQSAAITLFGTGSKIGIEIRKSQFLYLASTITDSIFEDCLQLHCVGNINNSKFINCNRVACTSVSSFQLIESSRISVVLDQNNPRSISCNNVSMVGNGSHVKLGLTNRVPVITNIETRATPTGYSPKAEVVFTTGANNLPVAQYANQNNQVEVVPFYEDSELLFKHINSEILSQINGIADPLSSLSLFSSIDHGTPSYTRNTSSWLDSLKGQLTCVSVWNSVHANLRAGVAITKRHIQFARHFPLQSGATIRFITSDNQVVNRTISRTLLQSGSNLNDIGIGLLDSDLPESIVPTKVFLCNSRIYLPSESSGTSVSSRRLWLPQSGFFYIDQDKKALIADWSAWASGQFGVFKPLENNVFYDLSIDGNKHDFFEPIITNDSGGPAFAIINGECVLLGCLYEGNAAPEEGQYSGTVIGETGDGVLNALIAAIDAAEGISTGYTVTYPDLSGFSEVS